MSRLCSCIVSKRANTAAADEFLVICMMMVRPEPGLAAACSASFHQEFDMHAFICTACGTQYPPSRTPPAQCPICRSEERRVGKEGRSRRTTYAIPTKQVARAGPVGL